jgi:integrase
VVELPKGVHRVVSRGREYFYWHPGRGTAHEGKRTALPNDPTLPEFWVKLREAQGLSAAPSEMTVQAVADLFRVSKAFPRKAGTADQYERQMKVICAGFGNDPITVLVPSVIREIVEGMEDRPGAANNFLGVMRAFSTWSIVHGYLTSSMTEGVKPYKVTGGHKPWTSEQIAAADKHLTGMVRRGVMLALYTGQRGSDVVRLGPTFVDEGGFDLSQIKTGREVWCPILPELAKEMADWERRPGPYMLQESGKPYTRKRFSIHFDEAREGIPELESVTLHGLRATAVVRLRQAGLETAQIQDVIGMSMAMIERYSRFANRKQSGRAAIVKLAERAKAKSDG